MAFTNLLTRNPIVIGSAMTQSYKSAVASVLGSPLTLRVEKVPGGRVALEVADNGPGIPEDIRPNIFRQFASKKTGGWGIGLHNCKLLVTAHGGKIDFTSKTGIGTTFRVVIPDEARQK